MYSVYLNIYPVLFQAALDRKPHPWYTYLSPPPPPPPPSYLLYISFSPRFTGNFFGKSDCTVFVGDLHVRMFFPSWKINQTGSQSPACYVLLWELHFKVEPTQFKSLVCVYNSNFRLLTDRKKITKSFSRKIWKEKVFLCGWFFFHKEN